MAEPTDEEKRDFAELKAWGLQRAIANADQCLPVGVPSYSDLLVQRDELLAACNGLVGLLQLLAGRPDVSDELRAAMMGNHRVTDAVLAIAKATGSAS